MPCTFCIMSSLYVCKSGSVTCCMKRACCAVVPVIVLLGSGPRLTQIAQLDKEDAKFCIFPIELIGTTRPIELNRYLGLQ